MIRRVSQKGKKPNLAIILMELIAELIKERRQQK